MAITDHAAADGERIGDGGEAAGPPRRHARDALAAEHARHPGRGDCTIADCVLSEIDPRAGQGITPSSRRRDHLIHFEVDDVKASSTEVLLEIE